MNRFRPYLSFLLLSLLLFPLGEKAIHEFGHLSEFHCDVHEKHYCAVEHTCSLCDFVFSASAIPPAEESQTVFFRLCSQNFSTATVHNTLTPVKYTFPLRGPPVSV